MKPLMRSGVLCALTLCLAALPAGAATVTFTTSVPLQLTDWYTTINLPKFDPSQGTLTQVSFDVSDSLVHKIEFENQSPTSHSTVRDSVYVTVDVQRPASTSLVSAVAKLYRTATVSTYDGTLDYAGTSGITLDGLTATATGSGVTSAPADLTLFSGTGTIALPCQAEAYFMFSYSGGNARFRLTTQATARVSVTYTYDRALPAHATSWGRIKSLYR